MKNRMVDKTERIKDMADRQKPKFWLFLILPVFSFIALLIILDMRIFEDSLAYSVGLLMGVPLGMLERKIILDNKLELIRFLETPYLLRMHDDELAKTNLKANAMVFIIFLMAFVFPIYSVFWAVAALGPIGVFAYKTYNEIYEEGSWGD